MILRFSYYHIQPGVYHKNFLQPWAWVWADFDCVLGLVEWWGSKMGKSAVEPLPIAIGTKARPAKPFGRGTCGMSAVKRR
jgi:hypothetical protein